MDLHQFSSKGIEINYFPTLFGNVTHASISLEYQENGSPLFTNESLIELRRFLYKYNVTSIEFSPLSLGEYRRHDSKSPLVNQHYYQTMGTVFGDLINSLPLLKIVYINTPNNKYGEIGAFYPTHRNAFENALVNKLKLSIAQPILYMDIDARSGSYIESDVPMQGGDSYQKEYQDERTLGQRLASYSGQIPLLGKLTRSHDHWKHNFITAINQVDLQSFFKKENSTNPTPCSEPHDLASHTSYQSLYRPISNDFDSSSNDEQSDNSLRY